MSMVIRTNLNSMNANRNLGINNSQVAKAIEKLASGYAINRAADDASGLAITEKMQAQITGLDQGTDNALEGIGLVQTAEGAMDEIHSVLNRIVELATKSANGTIQDEVDREAVQAEVDVLVDEIDRIAQSTNYNGIDLLNGNLSDGGLVIKTNTYTETVTTENTTGGSGSTDGSGGTDGTTFVSKLNIDTSLSTTIGSFTITGGVENVDFSYSGGVLTILTDTHMRIDGNNVATTESIVVDDSASSANLALKDVNITNSTGSAFYTGNNKVYIELEGINELSSTNSCSAALNVGEFGTVVIDGAGILTATGATGGSGIGSDGHSNSNVGDANVRGGEIIINGGTIIAISGSFGSGIGSGAFGTINDITITGGNVTSTGGSTGAGIGTGIGGTSGNITYVEECVTAIGGADALDIGEGVYGTVLGTITIIPLTTTDDDNDTDCETTYTTTTVTRTETEVYNGDGLILHVADQNETYNKIRVYIDPMTGEALKIKPLYVDTQELAGATINIVKDAINYVSTNRCNVGALQNRLEHTINGNNSTSENMTASKSAIKDADMAKEMMEFTTMNVLTQASQAMLAQSNQATQQILSLLG